MLKMKPRMFNWGRGVRVATLMAPGPNGNQGRDPDGAKPTLRLGSQPCWRRAQICYQGCDSDRNENKNTVKHKENSKKHPKWGRGSSNV